MKKRLLLMALIVLPLPSCSMTTGHSKWQVTVESTPYPNGKKTEILGFNLPILNDIVDWVAKLLAPQDQGAKPSPADGVAGG